MKIGRYVIGILSGLTFGMLFAPKHGKELRKEIFSKSKKDPVEGLKALGNAFKGAGEEALEELKVLSEHKDVAELLELSKDKMRAFLDDARERGYDVASVVQEKLEGLADMAREKAGQVKSSGEEAIEEYKPVVLRKKAIGKSAYRSAKKTKK